MCFAVSFSYMCIMTHVSVHSPHSFHLPFKGVAAFTVEEENCDYYIFASSIYKFHIVILHIVFTIIFTTYLSHSSNDAKT